MADHSVFSTAGRTPSAQMNADLSTLHAPEAAAEVVDQGCRPVRERGQIDIVRSACRQGRQAHGNSSNGRYWRKAGARHGDNISALPEPNKHELRGQRQLLMARHRLPRSLRLCRRLEVKRTRCARRAIPGVPNRTLRAPGRELWYPPPNAMGRFNEAADPQMALAARAERPRVLARLHDSTKWPGVPTS
jgi:hypothetical protein